MATKSKKCPFCEAEVKKENLERHIQKVHGDLSEKDFEKKGLQKPKEEGGEDEKEVKRGARKRKPRKKDRTGMAVAVIAMIVILSLVGYGVYRYVDENWGGQEEDKEESIAQMSTTLGTITIELDLKNAPATSLNFIDLAKSGFYNGVIFHRVIAGFMVQGGGFTADGTQKSASQIPWEGTGLLNDRYTISMARSGDANKESDSGTASSQFFINLVDNPSLDGYTYPYVVFGKVIDGFNVVDAIGALSTGTYNGMEDWPDNPPVITSVAIEG